MALSTLNLIIKIAFQKTIGQFRYNISHLLNYVLLLAMDGDYAQSATAAWVLARCLSPKEAVSVFVVTCFIPTYNILVLLKCK